MQAAGHCDFGEVDRQQPGVVGEGERYLGAAQRRAGRRAGENDVRHLLGPQSADGLRAQHPRYGIQNVRLAGAVWAHDNIHTRPEFESGAIGKGLEAHHR
jgi:hypothetical protein